MTLREGNRRPVRLGSGPALSPEALGALGRVIASRSPVLDTAKSQLLIAAAFCLLVALGAWGVARLVWPSYGMAPDETRMIAAEGEGEAAENPGEARVKERPAALRDDLFRAPQPKKTETRRQPRVNPVKLLEQIELQGVIGGARPRAMVMYKNSNETVTISAGDDLGEFQVMEIKEGSVVLKWRDELFELSL